VNPLPSREGKRERAPIGEEKKKEGITVSSSPPAGEVGRG